MEEITNDSWLKQEEKIISSKKKGKFQLSEDGYRSLIESLKRFKRELRIVENR